MTRAILFSLPLALLTSVSFGQGGSSGGTGRPTAPTAPVLRPSGEVFKWSADSRYTIDKSKVMAQTEANAECKSGKAVRVSNWDVTDGTAVFPGKCVEQDNAKYCQPDSEVTFKVARASFRCR